MESRVERLARNEAMFREVNERVESVHSDWSAFGPETPLRIVCECSHADCAEMVEIGANAYTAVREDPTRFIVLRGHDEPDVERVVQEQQGYAVVEKTAGLEFVT